LNENDIWYNQNEFKSSLYNTISFDNIMLELITDNKRNTITLGLSNSSVLNLMNWGITLTNFNKNEWVWLVEGGELQTNCNAQWINPNTSRVRIWMTSNNENDCSSNDSVLGIWITDGWAMSVWNYCNSTLCDWRATASSTSINSFWYLYIR
jgi:hypothetical protein